MNAFAEKWQAITQDHIQTLEAQDIVGASMMFIQGGETIGQAFHGFADQETQRLVDEHTIYHWASITKTFTGIAIMQLRDRGLLSLDDPIVHYLPELRAVHNPFGKMEDITLGHLMSHSSGFRNPTWPWGGGEPWHPHEPTTWEQLVAMMPYTEILFEPGTESRYSNPGIIFLGRVIEILTGDDYEVYIDKNILKPLGMYNSYFDHTPYHLLEHRSNNYFKKDGTLKPNGLDFDTGITVSNGGLNAPMTDMVKYLTFLKGMPDHQEAYDGILKRSSLEEMWINLFEIGRQDKAVEYRGLTFFIMEQAPVRVIGHTGSQQAFMSFFYIDPVTRSGCIAAYNTVGIASSGEASTPDTRALMYAFRSRLFDEIFPTFLQ